MPAAHLSPSASLPGFLQSQPWAAPQSYLGQLPGMFNTTGLRNSYTGLENQNFNQGSAIAAAAANQYVQRANQVGGSALGAGFAQASAMLPVYQQNAQMNQQLQNQLLQYHAQQAQIGAGLSGDIGRLQGGYQSTLSDYLTTQQKLAQQNQQFGVSSGQQQQGITNLAQYQQGQLRNQAATTALQYAPRGSGSYSSNMSGGALDPGSLATMNQDASQQKYLTGILGGLGFAGAPSPAFSNSPLPGPMGVSSGVSYGGYGPTGGGVF